MISHFLNPIAFWWLFLLPLIVLLYFLKLKRDEHLFPSTMLWQKTIEDLRVNSPFQRLKNNLLLLLQLLLVFLTILALARPFGMKKSRSGRHIVLLLDVSASMQACDEGRSSRLDKAKELAEKIIQDMSEGDRMMLICFSSNARIYQPFTGVKNLLKQKIREIEATDEETKLEQGLTIANAMLQKLPSPLLYIITDGAIPELDRILEGFQKDNSEEGRSKKSRILPQFILVGQKAANVAILALEVKPELNHCQAFVRVQNLGDKIAKGYLQLSVQGETIQEQIRLIELGPGDVGGFLFKNLPTTQGQIEAHFQISEGEDYLKMDNTAYFYLHPRSKASICLVSKGNFFLQKALAAYDEQLTILEPEQYTSQRNASADKGRHYNIVVFDQVYPQKPLPPGGYLFIHCLPFLDDIQGQGELKSAQGDTCLSILDQNEFHPLMRFVDMRHLAVAKAMKVDWPAETVSLLEAENHSILGCFSRNNRHYVVVAFDLLQSDWPLRLSFPVFIANTIEWFSEKQRISNIRVGDSIQIVPPEKSSLVIVTDPRKRQTTLKISQEENLLLDNIRSCGFYHIDFPGRSSQTLAANLFSSQESTIQPRTEIKVKDQQWSSREAVLLYQELWRYFCCIAFFVLIFEWYCYHRRSLFRRKEIIEPSSNKKMRPLQKDRSSIR